MDSQSCQQEEADSTVNRPLVQTSNRKIDAQSGISKLPVELLSLIFYQCDSAIRPRLVLTHTCQRWRLIAVNYRHLWTDLRIIAPNIVSDACSERLESLLVLQVDRSGGLPLNITLDLNSKNNHFIRLLDSIQDIAPFSRWRSLDLSVSGRLLPAGSPLTSAVGFPNLESLVLLNAGEHHIVAILSRAAMPKLKFLHLWGCHYLPREETLIMSLTRGTLSLPDSIITLQARSCSSHPFPNILNYRLKACSFYSKMFIDLRSMTNLIIDGWLHVNDDCHILLPALQYLRFMTMRIRPGGKIEAPVLQTLHLSVTTDPDGSADSVPLRYAVNTPGYRLSPKKLLIDEPYIPKGELIELLKKSRELTQATICLNDREFGQEVMETLFHPDARNNSPDERLCPQLAELRLDCQWQADVPLSAEKWLNGLEARKSDPAWPRVSVKARRMGEERYQLLAEG